MRKVRCFFSCIDTQNWPSQLYNFSHGSQTSTEPHSSVPLFGSRIVSVAESSSLGTSHFVLETTPHSGQTIALWLPKRWPRCWDLKLLKTNKKDRYEYHQQERGVVVNGMRCRWFGSPGRLGGNVAQIGFWWKHWTVALNNIPLSGWAAVCLFICWRASPLFPSFGCDE